MRRPKRLSFGSIDQRASGKYRARYRNPDNKTQWINAPYTFQQRGQAAAWLTKIEAKILTGQWVHPDEAARLEQARAQAEADAARTVGQWATQWEESISRKAATGELSPGTHRQYRSQIKPFIATFQNRPLQSLTREDCDQWIAAMRSSGASTSQIENRYRAASSCLHAAIEAGLIEASPLRLPKSKASRAPSKHHIIDPLPTHQQIDALVANSSPQVGAAILLAAYCGLRGGEIAALTRQDLTLTGDDPRVVVSKSAKRNSTGETVIGPPKSRRSYRTINIPPNVAKRLHRYALEHVEKTPDALFVYVPGHPESHLAGDRLRRGKGRYDQARAAVGLPDGFRFHDLRAVFLTRLGQAGATLAELQEAAGHEDAETVMIYQRTEKQRMKNYAKALDAPVDTDTNNVIPLRSQAS